MQPNVYGNKMDDLIANKHETLLLAVCTNRHPSTLIYAAPP